MEFAMSIEKYRKHCFDLVRIRSLLDDADGSLDDADGSLEALAEAQRLSWELLVEMQEAVVRMELAAESRARNSGTVGAADLPSGRRCPVCLGPMVIRHLDRNGEPVWGCKQGIERRIP